MMKFSKRDSRKMIKEMARLHGLSVSEVREQIQGKIIDYKAIGQRIKIARIKKGITQEAVADLIDITPAHMSNVETGKTKVSLPTLIEIANALSVSVDVLLCDNVLASQNIFKGEAKEIFEDCDEYETRFLVDLLKCAKSAMRRDKEVRNQFNR